MRVVLLTVHSLVCRAGFIAVDIVLALLVLAFVFSTLVSCVRNLACSGCIDMFSTLWRRKVSLLVDCLTCAAMILSKGPLQACLTCFSPASGLN